MDENIDVLIIGSGPVGAAFARRIADRSAARILVVEAGEALTPATGVNIRNLAPEQREAAYASARAFPLAALPESLPADALQARPGTHLLDPASPHSGMPAAALSTNLGGMGVHWTCACPRPGGSEVIPFLDPREMADAWESAEHYLQVTREGFPATAIGRQIVDALNQHFASDRPPARLAQPMPLACAATPEGKPRWSGVDAVLGELAEEETRRQRGVEIRTATLCTRILSENGVARGAEMRDLRSGEQYVVTAKAVVVAADALRTPQLLYASGIRPRALGRWLNDQPQVIALIEVDAPPAVAVQANPVRDGRDNVSGVTWLPFHEPDFPFHGQLMQMDTSPIAFTQPPGSPTKPVVGLGLFLAKELREEDRIVFSDNTDAVGLPKMQLNYQLTDGDRRRLQQAVAVTERVGVALGRVAPGGEAIILPAGTSLHYQGTCRLGEANDGSSVADRHSRVWDFHNLYVGGNGVIPTSTACNPTLTSVALAILAADDIVARLL
ncbi:MULTISPECIES: GMC oxidoreductase [Klebsiella]|uniref:GMC oxidoreductase n=1 Tax=Klebsiella TaxID=570 RepID=UPI00297181DA|nr:GMC oxidoreductase [Klebsiella variicola]EKS1982119.1 GMC family oxidoreductase N-terminal domain-containing protein [Klebsiella variicola]ELW9495283.1 GMC family oxidoreductase N-terminal domain-containing protein [Klebsiella variicola]ELW9498883.1 GMC family oxidoreductase N-terminal domain-containing protein [Klebsiella variicola]ELW9498904.1 GMC family oxidoreductase N-terminal domain-containing protein [Klebsiella variicola]